MVTSFAPALQIADQAVPAPIRYISELFDAEFLYLFFEDLGGFGGGAAGLLEFVAEFFQFGAAGHQGGEFVAGDLALGVVAEAAAAFGEQEPVADRVGVVRVVGDEDDAEAAFTGLDDVAQHDAGLFDTERGG